MRRFFTAVVAAAAVLGLAACDDPKKAPQAATPPPPMPVKVANPVVKRIVDWDDYTGRFEPTEMVEVRARVSGYLASRHFKDGQLVDKGQLLFVVDPRPYEATVERAKADVQRALTRQDLTGSELARSERLLAANAVSREEYETRKQARRDAEAQVASARAAARSAELDLEFTQIKSPIRGRISDRRVDVGNLVSGGSPQSTMLTTIMALDPIYFMFDSSEADYLRHQRLAGKDGQRQLEAPTPVKLRLADETGWPHRGRMDFVDNELNTRAGTIRGRAVFANADGFLTPGVFGRLRLPASEEYDAVMVPDSAIVSDQARKMVMTVGPDGVVAPKVVTLGQVESGLRVIRTGLKPDDQVIIEGIQRARPGAKVAPQPAKIDVAQD